MFSYFIVPLKAFHLTLDKLFRETLDPRNPPSSKNMRLYDDEEFQVFC